MTRARSNSSSLVIVVAALVLAAIGVYLNIGRGGPENGTSEGEADTRTPGGGAIVLPGLRAPSAPIRQLRISPEKLDLGVISQCGPRVRPEVVLNNEGSEPVRITGWIATCSCVVPDLEPGMVVPPGGFLKVPIRLDPLGLGGKSQRLDFRVEGNARGGSVRIDYEIRSAILPMPVMVVRPDREDIRLVDLERVDDEGNNLTERFAVRSIEPPVARFAGSAGDGHAAIEVDFKAIDELAGANPASELFEWSGAGERRKWKSVELVVLTDCTECGSLRVRVRNH